MKIKERGDQDEGGVPSVRTPEDVVPVPLTLPRIMSHLVHRATLMTINRFSQVLIGYPGVSNVKKVDNSGLRFTYT